MYVQSTGITAGGDEAEECAARYDYRVVLTAGKDIDQPERMGQAPIGCTASGEGGGRSTDWLFRLG